ncbi:MAG: ABC transporter ATP-binding protein [Methanotrichaceae archaeon]
MRLQILSLQGISKYYGKNRILDGIDLEVHEGEIFVLLGSNGCGKSTLLRIMATLLRPDSGEALIFGSKGSPENLLHVGIMFDHTAHWDKLTGYENAWMFARSYGLSGAQAASKLDNLFKWIGIFERRNEAVATYSYGMRRKLSLIEALVHEPDLLLMDEPSMGLDYSSRLAIYSHLQSLADNGMTIVLSTNDVSEAELLASRVALLKEGHIIALDRPEHLVASLNALTRIELKLAVPISIESIREIRGIEKVEVNGDRLRILADSNNDSLSSVVKKVTMLGGAIQKIEVKEPNLGDAFLKFSGENSDAA